MPASLEVRRGGSYLSNGRDSDIFLFPEVTAENLAAELALYPDVKPTTVAWNRKWYYDPAQSGAIHVFYDGNGKWYWPDNTEVT
jgi:hypothetical protein